MRLVAGSATDTGRVRGNNEDTFLVDNAHELFAIADGMGVRPRSRRSALLSRRGGP